MTTRLSFVSFVVSCLVVCWGPAPGWAGPGEAPSQPIVARDAAASESSPAPLDPAASLREGLRTVVASARDEVFPSLVSIQVVTVQYFGGKEVKGQSTGSGTILDPRGYVLTNAHVTDGGVKFVCSLADKRRSDCELVGEDPLTDLAVLKLDLEELGGEPLPVARFGESARLETGDVVMAMGSPYALSRSVSLGIVSNTERVFAGGFGSNAVEEMELEGGQRTGLFTRWIQHDASISPGNSGGPLVDLAGRVVGVNELGGGSLGFAIPSDLARRVMGELIESGRVARSWLGVSFQPVLSAGLAEGVLVGSVVADGPADRAGVEAGDVLVAVDGEPLTVRFAEQVPPLLDRLASTPVGGTVRLSLERDGEPVDATVETEALTDDLGAEAGFHSWGLTAQDLTPKMARDRRMDSTDGVLVTGVRRGGPAQQAEPPIVAGDVLRSIDGEPVAGLDGLIERFGALDGSERLVFAVERRGEQMLSLVRPRADEAEDPPRELPRSWVGLAAQPVSSALAEALGLDAERGLRITRVYPGTRAEAAGLQVGDVLLALDGSPLEPAGPEDSSLLARRVRSLPLDQSVTLEVLRGGERETFEVALERTRLTPEEARRHSDRDFELQVRELTFFDRDAARLPADTRGVLVESADRGGWAGLGGLAPGDLIVQVDDSAVRGLRSFREAMKQVKAARDERVVVVVLRGVRTQFLFLEPDWSPQLETGAGS